MGRIAWFVGYILAFLALLVLLGVALYLVAPEIDDTTLSGVALLVTAALFVWLMPRTDRPAWNALGLLIPFVNAWLFYSTFWRLAGQRIGLPSGGWSKLPKESLVTLQSQLGPNFARLDRLARRHNIFDQGIFDGVVSGDSVFFPQAFAFFLASMGNELAKRGKWEDSEEALRLSIQLRPERNAAHIGLANLLAHTGRLREAAHEARLALQTVEEVARATETEPQSVKENLGWDPESAEGIRIDLNRIIEAAKTETAAW